MVNNFSSDYSGMLAVERIEGTEIENYGVIGGTSVSKNSLELSRFAKNQKQVRRRQILLS